MEYVTLEQAASNYAEKESSNECYFSQCQQSFKDGAEWQKGQSKWISIDEHRPPLQKFILVYNTEGATLIAKRYVNGYVAFFSDGEKLMGELGPTHWMHLPEPPQD